MTPKISIVVPVYKVEKYIERCLKSILNQTFKEFELILVDDGSPDNCGKICDKYAEKDSRIKVIHKHNEGLSSVRNAGIEASIAKYIAFVDSDDYIDKNMYEILYNNIIKYDSDISICNFKYIYNNDAKIKENNNKEYEDLLVLNNIEGLGSLYENNSLQFVVAWNKLYKKDLFSNLRYKHGKIHEDEFIIHKLLYRSNRIVYTSLELYYYLQRQGSIIQSKFSLKNLDIVYAFKERMEFFRSKKLKYLEYKAQQAYISEFFKNYYKVKDELPQYDKQLKLLKRDYNRNLIYLLKNPYYNMKEKFMLIVFSIKPEIYELYVKSK